MVQTAVAPGAAPWHLSRRDTNRFTRIASIPGFLPKLRTRDRLPYDDPAPQTSFSPRIVPQMQLANPTVGCIPILLVKNEGC